MITEGRRVCIEGLRWLHVSARDYHVMLLSHFASLWLSDPFMSSSTAKGNV